MAQSLHSSPGFYLLKYYMDCVDDYGNVFIGYSAALKWKRVILNYANIIQYDNAAGTIFRKTIKAQPAPFVTDKQVTWSAGGLSANGRWESIDEPIQKILLHNGGGAIRWLCFQPKAHARIVAGDDKIISGLGYTEKLELSIKPWHLPFSRLRWGRYLSEQDTIVWINWSGGSDLNLLFYNGNLITDAKVSDESVGLGSGGPMLAFEDMAVIRKGALISTALVDLPGISRVFPNNIVNTYECKWRSRGILKDKGKILSTGWIIHEVVQWD
jgi:hypothetical protein